MGTKAKGLFLSFEGIDGSGKSTQARLLAERLRAAGRDVVLTREPGGSPGGEEIRKLVLTGDRGRWSAETEILLFTASRRDHLEKTIRPALAQGALVITDRFADSTRLYQGVTRGDLRAVVDKLHQLMIGMEPDLTVLIDMDPATALGRSVKRLENAPALPLAKEENPEVPSQLGAEPAPSQFGRVLAKGDRQQHARSALVEDRFETFGLPFQERLRDGFLSLAREFPDRFRVIDGNRPEAEVAEDVAEAAFSRMALA